MIDATDRKILDLLQENARLSNAEMAEAVGLTVSSVHERVKKMEKKGIIKGYVAMVDPDKLGKPLLAFIRLTVGTHAAVSEGIQKLCERSLTSWSATTWPERTATSSRSGRPGRSSWRGFSPQSGAGRTRSAPSPTSFFHPTRKHRMSSRESTARAETKKANRKKEMTA